MKPCDVHVGTFDLKGRNCQSVWIRVQEYRLSVQFSVILPLSVMRQAISQLSVIFMGCCSWLTAKMLVSSEMSQNCKKILFPSLTRNKRKKATFQGQRPSEDHMHGRLHLDFNV